MNNNAPKILSTAALVLACIGIALLVFCYHPTPPETPVTPTPTWTATFVPPTHLPSPTLTFTPVFTPTATETLSPIVTDTPSPSFSPTDAPTVTPPPSLTPSPFLPKQTIVSPTKPLPKTGAETPIQFPSKFVFYGLYLFLAGLFVIKQSRQN